jgi:hypothetical protein
LLLGLRSSQLRFEGTHGSGCLGGGARVVIIAIDGVLVIVGGLIVAVVFSCGVVAPVVTVIIWVTHCSLLGGVSGREREEGQGSVGSEAWTE